ncbi:43512_t:CDS:1, partial [Gigaspora margarita]
VSKDSGMIPEKSDNIHNLPSQQVIQITCRQNFGSVEEEDK